MSRRPQAPKSNVPNRRPRRPQVPSGNQSIVSRDERSRGRPQSINQLVVAEEPRPRGTPSALVPHKPQRRQNPNALVAYEEPEPQYQDEYYDQPPARPLMAQFCQPRCCILLLLVLFFGLLLLIAIILLVMSIEKGDPEGIAGWTYPIPARDPNGKTTMLLYDCTRCTPVGTFDSFPFKSSLIFSFVCIDIIRLQQ